MTDWSEEVSLHLSRLRHVRYTTVDNKESKIETKESKIETKVITEALVTIIIGEERRGVVVEVMLARGNKVSMASKF